MITSSGDVIRILLVDDHTLLRQALRQVLTAEPGLSVVAEAGNPSEALVLARRHQPDVILLDVEMPDNDPALLLRRLQSVAPEARVIILTMYDSPSIVRELLALNARGYMLKSVSQSELVAGIRSVYASDHHVVMSISRRSLVEIGHGTTTVLSAREQEVLELTSQALTNAQIASRLDITEGTVKRHLRNIFSKLDAVSRIDAVNKAFSAALITAPRQRPTPG